MPKKIFANPINILIKYVYYFNKKTNSDMKCGDV